MRTQEFNGKEMIIVPKALRKRFTNMQGVLIDHQGRYVIETKHDRWSQRIDNPVMLNHYRKCLPSLKR